MTSETLPDCLAVLQNSKSGETLLPKTWTAFWHVLEIFKSEFD